MPKSRKSQISLSNTPYYHCISRCVRRAFLCGEENGRSFEHRRQWVEDRIHALSEVFAIDVCAYTVMSNHTHLILHVNKEKADALSTEDVIQRWHKLYKGTLLSQRYMSPDSRKDLHEIQIKSVELTAEVWRKRLFDISWFMRALNEYIARAVNKEDDCTGHFWEGRFKSQALLDESALAACMAYVDLNPVRVKMAKTPETSDHTSIKYRINAAPLCQDSIAMKKEPRTKKDLWIRALVERRGKKCASVALANKTVRTAYAMLTKGTEYEAELLPDPARV